MVRRALLVVTSHDRLGHSGKKTGLWLSSLTHVHEVLASAGVECDILSPRGGRAPVDPTSVDLFDRINQEFLEHPEVAARLGATYSPRGVSADDYRIVCICDGHGALWDLARDPSVARVVQHVHEVGGVLAGVGHGVAALLPLTSATGEPLVRGRTVAAFTDAEETLTLYKDHVPFSLEGALAAQGARLTTVDPFEPNVVVDGRIVTGQNPQSSRETAEVILDVFEAL
jgi:putative intracellular protease/amidase